MKSKRKKRVIILIAIALVLIAFIGFARAAWDFTPDQFTRQDYSRVMEETIGQGGGNPRVVDIAMLGAHDVFSAGISMESKADPTHWNPLVNIPFLKLLANGLMVRVSRTQKSTVYDLARHGVRYFDARASLVEGVWYGAHGLLARPLEEELRDLIRFMSETQGEILLIDFQIVEGGEPEELLEYIGGVKEQGRSLLDFVRYEAGGLPLEELRYRDVVQSGSGAVLLFWMEDGPMHYDRFDAMWCPWHNTNSPKALLRGIEEMNGALRENPGGQLDEIHRGWGMDIAPKENPGNRADYFRWNQAQLTAQMGFPALFRNVTDWSLLTMAHRFNYRMLPFLADWLPQMPIFGVDYADDMNHGFNDKAMEIINAYNKGLR